MNRLSSDYLYHYKQSFDVIKLILKYGFSHRLWDENIPFLKSQQLNYIICFCDILWKDNQYHMSCYGNNIIVLKKEWAIRNNITPVHYIHENSTTVSSDWVVRKTLNRHVQQYLQSKNIVNKDTYRIALGVMESEIITNSITASSLLSFSMDQNYMNSFYTKISNEISNQINQSNDLGRLLQVLFAELEKRDAISRVYMDDFFHPTSGLHKDKVLYDEKEWRSCKMPSPNDAYSSFTNKCLDQSDNIKFDDNDIEYIIVEDATNRNVLINEINNGSYLISRKSTRKVLTLKMAKKIMRKRARKENI